MRVYRLLLNMEKYMVYDSFEEVAQKDREGINSLIPKKVYLGEPQESDGLWNTGRTFMVWNGSKVSSAQGGTMIGRLEIWESATCRESQVPACLHLGEEVGKVGWGQASRCLESPGLIPQVVKSHWKFLSRLKTVLRRDITGNRTRVFSKPRGTIMG